MCGTVCCCCCVSNCCCLALFSTQYNQKESFKRLWVIVWILANIYYLFGYSAVDSFEENQKAMNIFEKNVNKTDNSADDQRLNLDSYETDAYYHSDKLNLALYEPKVVWVQNFQYFLLVCITLYNIKGITRLLRGEFLPGDQFYFHMILTNILTFFLVFQDLTYFKSFALYCIPLIYQAIFKCFDRYNTGDFLGSVFLWGFALSCNLFFHFVSTWGLISFIFHNFILPIIEYPLVFTMAAWFFRTSDNIIKKISNDTYLMHTRDKTKKQIIDYFFSDISQVFLLVLCFFCIHYSEMFIEFINGYKPALTSVIISFTYSVPFALLLNYPKSSNAFRRRDIFIFNVIPIMFCLQFFSLL